MSLQNNATTSLIITGKIVKIEVTKKYFVFKNNHGNDAISQILAKMKGLIDNYLITNYYTW